MPSDLQEQYLDLHDRCAVVKLVGTALSAADVLPVLELLRDATTPVIGMAMGAPGTCTRILAPAFPRTVLTYGAATAVAATAPGQITVDEMTDRYALHLVTPDTRVYVHVTRPDDALSAQQQAEPGTELHVPLRTEDPALRRRLADTVPFMIVTSGAVYGAQHHTMIGQIPPRPATGPRQYARPQPASSRPPGKARSPCRRARRWIARRPRSRARPPRPGPARPAAPRSGRR